MWSRFGAAMERANQLAKQAQDAAEKLEKHLDESLLQTAEGQPSSTQSILPTSEVLQTEEVYPTESTKQEADFQNPNLSEAENEVAAANNNILVVEEGLDDEDEAGGWADEDEISSIESDSKIYANDNNEHGGSERSQKEVPPNETMIPDIVPQEGTTVCLPEPNVEIEHDDQTGIVSENVEDVAEVPPEMQTLGDMESSQTEMKSAPSLEVPCIDDVEESHPKEQISDSATSPAYETDAQVAEHQEDSQEMISLIPQDDMETPEDVGHDEPKAADVPDNNPQNHETPELITDVKEEIKEEIQQKPAAELKPVSVQEKPEEDIVPRGVESSDSKGIDDGRQLEKVHSLEKEITKLQEQLIAREVHFAKVAEAHAEEISSWQAKVDIIENERNQDQSSNAAAANQRVKALETKLREVSKQKDVLQDKLNSFGRMQADFAKESGISKALREEGEALAKKLSTMEQMVRSSRGELRDTQYALDGETEKNEKLSKEMAELKLASQDLRDELQRTKEKASTADKLDSRVLQLKEENQSLAAAKSKLELERKELEDRLKMAKEAAEKEAQAALVLNQQDKESMSKSHKMLVKDFEDKLAKSAREAHQREEALQQELGELRKRWQEAVRKADGLSLDMQRCTAPLMRQIKSLEVQARAREDAFAEVEARLRSELDASLADQKKMADEVATQKAKTSIFEQQAAESEKRASLLEAELTSVKVELQRLNDELDAVEREKDEWVQIQQNAQLDAANAKTGMMKNVVDTEERYRRQVHDLQLELENERNRVIDLERQLDGASMTSGSGECIGRSEASNDDKSGQTTQFKTMMKQEEILNAALNDLDDGDERDAFSEKDWVTDGEQSIFNIVSEAKDSKNVEMNFALMEQLLSKLRSASSDLETAKEQLSVATSARDDLENELSSLRIWSERAPQLESTIAELTAELQEKDNEIQGLREGMQEMRSMYRQQLDMLLEEKASLLPKTEQSGKSLGEMEQEHQRHLAETYTMYDV